MSRRWIGFLLVIALLPQLLVAQVDPFRPAAPGRADQSPRPGSIASVEFVDTSITTIFKMISDLTGWSIIMSPRVTASPPKINIWVKNLSAEQVLERVCTLAGLVYERKGNTVEIMTFDEYAKINTVEKKVVQLKNVRAKDLAVLLRSFLTEGGGSVIREGGEAPTRGTDRGQIIGDEATNKLILLVPQPTLDSLLKLIEMLDSPFEKDTVRVIQLKHLEASVLMPKLEEFLTETPVAASTPTVDGLTNLGVPAAAAAAQAGAEGAAAGAESSAEAPRAGTRWIVQFMSEPKLNAIVLRGLPSDVAKVAEVIAELDVPTNIKVVNYPLKFTNAGEVFDTLQEIIDQDARRWGGGGGSSSSDPPRLRVSASEQNNQIIVEGSAADQERMAKLIAAVDRPLPAGSGGMRVYRLENAAADEVASVIEDLIASRSESLARQERTPSAGPTGRYGDRGSGATPEGSRSALGGNPPAGPPVERPSGDSPGSQSDLPSAGDIEPAEVTAAPEINAVIIRASASEHDEFKVIIDELDKPRAQVMLEVTLVTVRSSEDFNLGLELSGARLGDYSTNALGFSTFGIGRANSRTGDILLANPPPIGFSAGVFNSGDFSLVLNTLRTVGDTRITSTPRTLVQDNAQSVLTQTEQEPYVSTSQGESSTITSFGGFVQAGTELVVIPHISKQNWLRLEYQVTLSSFRNRTAQQLAANIPPPKRESTSTGTVRIPADHTVVLGGLTASRDDRTLDEVPFVSSIPVVGELFRNRINNKVNETLFIFIRPIVLRDPAFRDLRYMSESDVRHAKLASKDYPVNALKQWSDRPQAVERQPE